MKRFALIAVLPLALVLALPTQAADSADISSLAKADGRYNRIGHGGVVTLGKARADTVYILGGADRLDGKFQDASGAPDWQGWTHVDLTAPTAVNWNCADYHCQNLDPETVPNHAWWCGTYYDDDCGTGDFGGYGHDWLEYLDWTGSVLNPTTSVTVTVNAMVNHDTEPDWDFLYFGFMANGNYTTLETMTGPQEGLAFTTTFSISPSQYGGPGLDEVYLRWRFESDGNTDDEDCLYPSQGGAQVDLIEVYFDQGSGPQLQGYVEDCEGVQPVQWFHTFSVGVGDFAKVWPLLTDIDPCKENTTPQAGFIDDGLVVPGTGGYLCTTWCYGPAGYIVNPEGGLAGPEFHINNRILSEPFEWPGDQYDGAYMRWEVWSHEELSAVSPGIFYLWQVRSTDDPTGETGWSAWQSDNTVWFGPGVWINHEVIATELMVPGRRWVQIALDCGEYGWIWGYIGTDGTPSPSFDNVAFAAFTFPGPGVTADEINLAQDNFPEIGTYDYGNLAANNIRFDMARNISPPSHNRNDPGDSLFADVVAVRTGSVLNDLPKLYYKMKPNPIFDPVRTFPTEGWVYGDTTYTSAGAVVQDRYNFNLPDDGFLYPGDVVHYYIEAQDNVSGDIGTTLLPADTTGFSDFDSPMSYQHPYGNIEHPNFTIRGLPSFDTLSPGGHPPILFWNDNANRGAENEFSLAFQNLGYKEGVDYDMFYTNAPDAGEGNGLGGRATATQLGGYETILYNCGNLFTSTIMNGDFLVNGSNDVGVLDSWLRLSSKNMYLSGDDIVSDMSQTGTANLAFVNNWIGVTLSSRDLRPLIDNQATPSVMAIPGNGVINGINQWIAYGGCLGFNTFDAVTPIGTTQTLAEFLDPIGATSQYPYAAATLNHNETYDANIIYMPYSFHYLYSHPDDNSPGQPMAARTRVLNDILLYFGHIGNSPATDVPDAGTFTVRSYPNPFNPSAKIEYSMPRHGELSIKIYNLRGELVKVLLDQAVSAGNDFVTWDGTDAGGSAVASGVYFYETKALGNTSVNKMALVK